MPNLVQCFVGNLMIVAQNAKPPTDEEWDYYIDGLRGLEREKRLHLLQSVVFTEGGAPSSAQRGRLNDFLNGRAIRGAVVSPSGLVRGVVTALNWFNPKLKAFKPEQVDEAFRYVGLKESDLPVVWSEFEKLRRKLGGDTLKSISRGATTSH
jgi:hypothetical protein